MFKYFEVHLFHVIVIPEKYFTKKKKKKKNYKKRKRKTNEYTPESLLVYLALSELNYFKDQLIHVTDIVLFPEKKQVLFKFRYDNLH